MYARPITIAIMTFFMPVPDGTAEGKKPGSGLILTEQYAKRKLSSELRVSDETKLAIRDAPVQAKVVGWQNIFTDDLEGNFPGSNWTIYYNSVEAYWDDWTCWYGSSSNESAGCADLGADGIACGEDYPNGMNSWAIYGPFDLSNSSFEDAVLGFGFKLNSEPDYDFFFVGASINGSEFYGVNWSGYSEQSYVFDLTNVYTLGNLLGESEVWIAFNFQSDESITYSEGAQIDDIVIQAFSSCNSDSYEPNDSYQDAFQESTDFSLHGYICPEDDEDWFAVPIGGLGTYTIMLSSLPDDYDLEFYDPNIQLLVESDNGGTSSEEIIFSDFSMSGTHYIRVFGFGSANDPTDSYRLQGSWEVNNPPTVSITSGPSDTIDYDDVEFCWSGSDIDGTVEGYEIKMDGAGQSTTLTCNQYDNLPEGPHLFEVRAIDDDGDYSPWVSRSFMIALAQSSPTVSITSGPSSTIVYDDIEFCWSGSDADGTVEGYEIKMDEAGQSTISTCNQYYDLTVAYHTFEVRAIDNDGNYSEWVSQTFGVTEILIIDESIPDPNNPGASIQFVDFLNTDNIPYIPATVSEVNKGTVSLDSFEFIVLSEDAFSTLPPTTLGQKSLLLYNHTGSYMSLPNQAIAYDPSSKVLYHSSTPYPAFEQQPYPVLIDMDWSLRPEAPLVLAGEVIGAATGTNVISASFIAKDFSEGDWVGGLVGIIGSAAGEVFLFSLPLCAATEWAAGGACYITAISGGVKALTLIPEILDIEDRINEVSTFDSELRFDPISGILTYPSHGTINCHAYYYYDSNKGFYDLRSDAPSICQPAFTLPLVSTGQFTFDNENLYTSAVISAPTDDSKSNRNRVGAFAESVRVKVSKNSSADDQKVELDLNDDSFEHTGTYGTFTYAVEDNTSAFQDEIEYRADGLNPTSFFAEDFWVNSNADLTRLVNITITPNSPATAIIDAPLELKIDVGIELWENGVIQAMIVGDGVDEDQWSTVSGQQSVAVPFNITLQENSEVNKTYSVYVQYRPGVAEGPLTSSDITDLVWTMNDFHINWVEEIVMCCVVPGDASHDGTVNIGDITYLVSRIFLKGPKPECCEEADANGDCKVNIGDITYLVDRLFGGGEPSICGCVGMSCGE